MQEEKQISPTGPSDRIRRVLEEVERLDKEATPGPWGGKRNETGDITITGHDLECPNDPWSVAQMTPGAGYGEDPIEANAKHIFESRTLLPRLAKALAEVLQRMDDTGGQLDGEFIEQRVADILEGK